MQKKQLFFNQPDNLPLQRPSFALQQLNLKIKSNMLNKLNSDPPILQSLSPNEESGQSFLPQIRKGYSNQINPPNINKQLIDFDISPFPQKNGNDDRSITKRQYCKMNSLKDQNTPISLTKGDNDDGSFWNQLTKNETSLSQQQIKPQKYIPTWKKKPLQTIEQRQLTGNQDELPPSSSNQQTGLFKTKQQVNNKLSNFPQFGGNYRTIDEHERAVGIGNKCFDKHNMDRVFDKGNGQISSYQNGMQSTKRPNVYYSLDFDKEISKINSMQSKNDYALQQYYEIKQDLINIQKMTTNKNTVKKNAL